MAIVHVGPPAQYPTLPSGSLRRTLWTVREDDAPPPPKPRLLDRVRQALRARHLSCRTEEGDVAWIRRIVLGCYRDQPLQWPGRGSAASKVGSDAESG